MEKLNKYRKMEHVEICKSAIISSYNELFNGERKILPRGTWELNENVILIIRYVLEIKLQLLESEIPKINRQMIKEQKLWGALNRFKSIPKLIKWLT